VNTVLWFLEIGENVRVLEFKHPLACRESMRWRAPNGAWEYGKNQAQIKGWTVPNCIHAINCTRFDVDMIEGACWFGSGEPRPGFEQLAVSTDDDFDVECKSEAMSDRRDSRQEITKVVIEWASISLSQASAVWRSIGSNFPALGDRDMEVPASRHAAQNQVRERH
jgi:hypothetical protein